MRRLAKIEKARAFWRFPAVLSQRPYGLHQRLEEIAPARRRQFVVQTLDRDRAHGFVAALAPSRNTDLQRDLPLPLDAIALHDDPLLRQHLGSLHARLPLPRLLP